MIYTIEELNRISGSRRAIEGRQYKDTKGNIYIGTSTGRLEQRSISDKYVNVKLETDSKNENLNSTLNTINSNIDSLNNSLTNKQDLLVSGENIKTINGNNILGEGDLIISSEVNSFETVNQNIKAWDATFNYIGDDLTSIEYTNGVDTIIKTFNYTGPNLTSIVLSGDTPSGIELTKTFTYTGGNLTDITYT